MCVYIYILYICICIYACMHICIYAYVCEIITKTLSKLRGVKNWMRNQRTGHVIPELDAESYLYSASSISAPTYSNPKP